MEEYIVKMKEDRMLWQNIIFNPHKPFYLRAHATSEVAKLDELLRLAGYGDKKVSISGKARAFLKSKEVLIIQYICKIYCKIAQIPY